MKVKLGEIRSVGIEVFNLQNQEFEISVAEYEILDEEKNIIDRGIPTIDRNRIFTLFNAEERGKYNVVFKYHIEPEVLIANVEVEVL